MMKLWKNTQNLAGIGLVASAMALSGCGAIDPETGEERLRANPYNSQMSKKIHVDRLTPVLVVNFKQAQGELSDMEKGRILGFMDAQKAPYGSEMQVELPEFDDPERVNEARYGAIGAFLEDLGFVVTPKVVKDGLQNSLRVYHIKYVATVDPSCNGNWTEPDGNRFENLPLPHMGCATASALARMVVKPKDLVEPEGIRGTDGERAALSISNYRKRGTTSTGGSSSEGN
ncbi:hypothetical protein GUA87_13420 [Sneathiella sp. P13V-1]|uniref:CpaD family pilus assembly lipoprotein n=1 Tax=Sneathiella sp. P13V-1 TaxID=2697366 RepID=UPI00187B3EB8|nr:CpaD family pilus assembly lipoprotein [Sneathiella sp. P13V-1]MBE7637850.1 hypothetical protein [Sneathiella sp. P13V-1]